jgi:hypothetical protein
VAVHRQVLTGAFNRLGLPPKFIVGREAPSTHSVKQAAKVSLLLAYLRLNGFELGGARVVAGHRRNVATFYLAHIPAGRDWSIDRPVIQFVPRVASGHARCLDGSEQGRDVLGSWGKFGDSSWNPESEVPLHEIDEPRQIPTKPIQRPIDRHHSFVVKAASISQPTGRSNA